MSIVRYDPFRDLRTLQEEVNRLFSTNLTRAFDDDQGIGRGAWAPSVDIYENKDQIVLEAELPGMKQEDFDLSIENNVITLRGERKFEKTEETDNYHRVERSYGAFTRSFTLPQTVSAEGATAEYNNGVLRVTLPKREETKARRIQVSGTVSGSSQKTIETTSETGKAKEASGGR
jgi:HSP20 family protein